MPTVIALHGFTRQPRHLAAFSEACQLRGWACLRPALAPSLLPTLINSRRHLDRVTQRIVDSGRLEGGVVVVGHSAGAAAGSWITTRLLESHVDVRGLVYVDGNDSPNHLIEKSWAALADVPIAAVMAPDSPCNRNGKLGRLVEARRPGCVEVIERAGHGDLEMADSHVYRWACRDSSGPPEWRAVQEAVLGSVTRFLS